MGILIEEVGDYRIEKANPTGGKAGKGHNVTSTIQVFRGQHMMKDFRYAVGNPRSYFEAVRRARAAANALNQTNRIQ